MLDPRAVALFGIGYGTSAATLGFAAASTPEADTRLDQILAILLGRKVKDDAGLWHVFDAEGNEISDPGSVLLRGNIGALLTWPNPVIEEIVQQAGGPTHWHKLFQPIRTVTTPEVRVRGDTRWRLVPPETYDLRQRADAPTVSGTSRSRVFVGTPYTHAVAATARQVLSGVLHVTTPRCGGSAGFLYSSASSKATLARPSAACRVPRVSSRVSGYYTFALPETVQNPTEEMLLELLR